MVGSAVPTMVLSSEAMSNAIISPSMMKGMSLRLTTLELIWTPPT